jgi:hypothetical protein
MSLESKTEIKTESEIKLKDCDICATEKYEKLFVNCKCNISSCIECVKTFLLSDKDINPKCMNCKSSWTFDFIRDILGKNFDDKYREYRCKIIMERERSLLPQAQEKVTLNIKMKNLENNVKDINKLLLKYKLKKTKKSDELDNLKVVYSETADKNQKKEIKEQINKKEVEVKTIKSNVLELNKLKTQVWDKQYELRIGKKNPEEKSIGFQGHCPHDNCRGYLDKTGLCGICEKKACKSCKQKIHDGDCDKDILETIKMLAKDTKNCPSCNIPISKISGCDQMYCVSCHTAFSWESGKIETGRIHNPHYYEYMRNNNIQVREAGDVRCGGAVNFNHINDIFRNISDVDRKTFECDKVYSIIQNSYRFSGHVRGVLLISTYNYNNGGLDNEDLRIRYLSEAGFTEKKWLFNLKKREKAREKKNVLHGIYRMFADIVDELHANILEKFKLKYSVTGLNNNRVYNKIYYDPQPMIKELIDIATQIENLRVHTNFLMKKVETQFKNKVYYISPDFQ